MPDHRKKKRVSIDSAIRTIHRGDRLFVGTGCGEPQYLFRSFLKYANSFPNPVHRREWFHVWSLGFLSQATGDRVRYHGFFIADTLRDLIHRGRGEYVPLSLSQVPGLLRSKRLPLDVALVEVCPPDRHGFMSLGISVDATKAAVESANLVIAQINDRMPRVHGDTFIHLDQVDLLTFRNEPLQEYSSKVSADAATRIAAFVARLTEDGSTLQVGYGGVADAVLRGLAKKKHLGVHSEVLTDGMIDLMKAGAIDNRKKSRDPGKTVAALCMASRRTYEYIHDHPGICFRGLDYTNDPLVIAQQEKMVAVNSVLAVDLTGQVSAESVGRTLYSGIGGLTDFLTGSSLSPNGKTIMVMESTAARGTMSRIVPLLKGGAGVSVGRGDVQYVVTEHGIAYLEGKSVRERAMSLIAVAHPRFRPWLVEEAKNEHLIYRDQAFIAGENGLYPEDLESCRITKSGLGILLRPVRFTDEPLLKDFFYSLSEETLYHRFFSRRTDMPHEFLQRFVVIDYREKMAVAAVMEHGAREEMVGLGQCLLDEEGYAAELFLVVRDDLQNKGIGREMLCYLIHLARRRGLKGLTAQVLVDNKSMMHLFRSLEKREYGLRVRMEAGVFYLTLEFKWGPALRCG
jgi:acyl-CoA hydrolase/GNAT superfamily N-acetyltransferase